MSFLAGSIIGVRPGHCPPGVLGHLRSHSCEYADASLNVSVVVLGGLTMAVGSGEVGLGRIVEAGLCFPFGCGKEAGAIL